VKPSLGKIKNAIVILKDANTGIKVEERNTEDTGVVTFLIAKEMKNVIIEVVATNNTSYFDEATSTDYNDNVVYRKIPQGRIFRAAAQIAFPNSEMAVTAFTEAAMQRAETLQLAQGGRLIDHFIQSKKLVEQTFDIDNILQSPVIIESLKQFSTLDLSQPSALYALHLAALAKLANNYLGNTDQTPALTIAKALAQDFADGDINGSSNTGKLPYDVDHIHNDYHQQAVNFVNLVLDHSQRPLATNYNVTQLNATKQYLVDKHLSVDPIPLRTISIDIAKGSLKAVSEVAYSQPIKLTVRDSLGLPIKNQVIDISYQATSYLRGAYSFHQDKNRWIPHAFPPLVIIDLPVDYSSLMTPIACPSEDQGINGIGAYNGELDTTIDGLTEDHNSDGILWPGLPFSIYETRLVTDNIGQAETNLEYGKPFGDWLEASITFSLKRTPKITVTSQKTFILPTLESDVTDQTVAPPGGIESPFGIPSLLFIEKRMGGTDTAPIYKTMKVSAYSQGVISTTDLAHTLPALSTRTTPLVSEHLDPCTQKREDYQKYILRTE